MITVLHLITRMDMGGSAQNTVLACTHLVSHHRVVLAYGPSLESGMTAEEEKQVAALLAAARAAGVETAVVPDLFRRIRPFRDLVAFWAILRIIARFRPKIVHTHSSKAGVLGRWAAWLMRVERIVHTPHGHVFYGHFPGWKAWIFLQLERFSDLITDTTVALTRGEAADYVNLRVTCPEKLRIIHSGVDLNRFSNPGTLSEARRRLNFPDGIPVVGTIGWLLPIKGPDVLLRAMARVWERVHTARLVYVGKGDLEPDLKNTAVKMGVFERVSFLGWRDDVHDLLPAFDIFVLPSLNEGMGRVIVEAMAAGKPVIASDTGGIPDLVKHGRTGLLVPPGDEKALAEAILDLLDNPGKVKKMGEAGRARSYEFSLESMLSKLDDLYQKVLKQ